MKESEFDKINSEISTKASTLEIALSDSYYFGFAVVLNQLRIIISGHKATLTEQDVERLVEHYVELDERVKTYYERLKKDL